MNLFFLLVFFYQSLHVLAANDSAKSDVYNGQQNPLLSMEGVHYYENGSTVPGNGKICSKLIEPSSIIFKNMSIAGNLSSEITLTWRCSDKENCGTNIGCSPVIENEEYGYKDIKMFLNVVIFATIVLIYVGTFVVVIRAIKERGEEGLAEREREYIEHKKRKQRKLERSQKEQESSSE